jgi:hypothetical protein
MKQLESYSYLDGSDLVDWLRNQVNDMLFEKIADDRWPFDEAPENVEKQEPGKT